MIRRARTALMWPLAAATLLVAAVVGGALGTLLALLLATIGAGF